MHDILFRISGSFAIHSYGVMAMFGFLSAMLVARWRASKVGLSPDAVTDVCVWALVGGILGSRVFYFFQYDIQRPDWSFLDFFKLWEGGLVFYGGLIGGGIVTLLVLRAKKLKILSVLDILAPSMALGQAFGRIGCYLHGCCYGVPVRAGAWYGCVFPAGAVPYDPNATRPIPPGPFPPGTALWPTELVSSFDLLCIFVILSLFFRRRRRAGEVAALYLILCAVERFLIEFYRGDTHAPGVLSPAQWISIVLFPIGLALLVWLRTSPPEKVPLKR